MVSGPSNTNRNLPDEDFGAGWRCAVATDQDLKRRYWPARNIEIGEGRSPCRRARRLGRTRSKMKRTSEPPQQCTTEVSDDRAAAPRLPRSCCTCGLAMLAKPRFLRTGTSRTGQKSKSRLNSKGLIAGRRIRSDDFSLASLTAFKECVCGCRRTVCLGSIRSLRDGPV